MQWSYRRGYIDLYMPLSLLDFLSRTLRIQPKLMLIRISSLSSGSGLLGSRPELNCRRVLRKPFRGCRKRLAIRATPIIFPGCKIFRIWINHHYGDWLRRDTRNIGLVSVHMCVIPVYVSILLIILTEYPSLNPQNPA